ncbi:unnamed protein product [Phytophthora lilii]|uniref:Unnamed protein product n=1 Tax=Phytophthora lilii TaxID=2077276 RepID=A0A9W6U2G2_9STRA|nr:unnamed protein product [Phytophthora lilii]
MIIVAWLGFVSGIAIAQSKVGNDVVGENSGEQAAVALIDCSKTLNCELVPHDPVCGSDGITYANGCEFASAFCSSEHDADTLFIRATGVCSSASDDNDDREDASIALFFESHGENGYDRNVALKPSVQIITEVDPITVFCSLTCKLTPDQVCGTDGVTYMNDCHLLSSKCDHPELEKAAHGECAKSIDEIELNVLEASQATTTEALTAAPEKCNPMCERVYDPICGSDGITYANSCLLEYAECRNPSIKPFAAGKCPQHMQAARGSINPTSINNDGESCIPGPCPYTYAPVCGSDGQTHENLCLFANARCQHPQHALVIVHDGECNADTLLKCEKMACPLLTECREQTEIDGTVVAYCADVCSPDRCSEREYCELVDSDCFTAPCSPIAMCIPKVQDG